MTVSNTNPYLPRLESPLLSPRRPKGRAGDIGRMAFYVVTSPLEHRPYYVNELAKAIRIAPANDPLRNVFRPFLGLPLSDLEQFTLNSKEHFKELQLGWCPLRNLLEERELQNREIIIQTIEQYYGYGN